MRAYAPGKLMLAGEYAVLRGRPALVMAVNRYAVAEALPNAPAQSPEVAATLQLARREGYLTDRHPDIAVDCTNMAGADGTKLGLGGSAAGCVAALALARRLEGRTVDEALALGRVARRGHREAQGGGSGVDVLASALGGVLRVTVDATDDAEPAVRARTWPAHWPWAVLWTGTSARTSELLTAVAAFEARDPRSAELCWQGIGEATTQLDEAMATGDLGAAVKSLCAHGRWMGELGERAGVGIVTEALGRLARAAEPLGVGVKPSGAGGGDVALILGQDVHAVSEAVARAEGFGFVVVALKPDASGVRVTEQAMEDG